MFFDANPSFLGLVDAVNRFPVENCIGCSAVYFSRSPIPYVRDLDLDKWSLTTAFWGHVGLYAYRRKSLAEYVELPEAKLESAEKLEQLRLLEFGKKIITVEIEHRLYGVDTPADLEHVKRLLDPDQSSP